MTKTIIALFDAINELTMLQIVLLNPLLELVVQNFSLFKSRLFSLLIIAVTLSPRFHSFLIYCTYSTISKGEINCLVIY